MKRLLFYISIVAVFTFSNIFDSQAQRMDWDGPWSVGVGLGTTSYFGDLSEHNDNRFIMMPQSLSFSGLGWFSKGFGPLTLVLQMNLGRLQSRDYVKDLQMRSNFYDYGFKLRLNMNQILQGRRYSPDKWHFYTHAGYGLIRFSTNLTDVAETELVDQIGYAKIGRGNSMNIGAGIQYYMTNEASLHIGVDYHFLTTDEIDAVVKGDRNDSYLFMNLGFSYDFGSGFIRTGRRPSLRWGRF